MKYALYARVSTLDQNPEMQKKALINKANREGWDFEYLEEQESTRKTRPVKNMLYQKLLNKEYDGVCVWKIDRWARTAKEALNDIENIYNKGIPFISITDNIDLSTASGRLQFNVIVAFNQFERDLISERTREGLANAKAKGKKLGRPKGSKDKGQRRKSGYYQRWSK